MKITASTARPRRQARRDRLETARFERHEKLNESIRAANAEAKRRAQGGTY